MTKVAFAGLFAFAVRVALAAEPTAAALPPSNAESARLMRDIPPAMLEQVYKAESVGHLLAAYDRAAWVGTDALDVHIKPRDARLRGYLVESLESGTAPGPHHFVSDVKPDFKVLFIGEEDGTLKLLHSVITRSGVVDDSSFISYKPAAPLSEQQVSAFRSRKTAADYMVDQGLKRCAASYNTVVLPFQEQGKSVFQVYLMPAQQRRDLAPMGGYYRIKVSADGKSVEDSRAFSKACIDLELPSGQEKFKPVALSVTSLLDEAPTEVHEFVSLTYVPLPLMVLTVQNRMIWRMDHGKISYVSTAKEPAGDN